MARTKASVGSKVSSAKSSKARCSAPPPPSTSGASGNTAGSSRTSGGNSVHPRETPKWQRPITNFFINKDTRDCDSDGAQASVSTTKPKRNVIQSDDEEEPAIQPKTTTEPTPVEDTEETTAAVKETPKNQVLDETLELEPLIGDDSHKIDEFFPKNGEKGKGVGRKNKENVHNNNKRNSVKRTLDEITAFEDNDNGSKRLKVTEKPEAD